MHLRTSPGVRRELVVRKVDIAWSGRALLHPPSDSILRFTKPEEQAATKMKETSRVSLACVATQ